MTRMLTLGAAQLGPIAKSESRKSAVDRMIALMEKARTKGCRLVVFPELALTTFFPRWFEPDLEVLDRWFETEMPNADTQPLFDKAKELGIGFSFGYAERVVEDGKVHHYNASVLVDEGGKIIGKYRKIHLPGHFENEPWRPFQHLEKRYFEPGNLGFGAFRGFDGIMGMGICNDRRWPETYRVLALQGVEVMMVGYNTPVLYAPVPQHDHLQSFHNHICMQAGAYQNGMWIVGVAKAGMEEGSMLLGQSCIIAPTGEIVAQAHTLEDELITYDCDLDQTKEIKENIFNFALHREPEAYRLITETKGPILPD